MIESQVLDGRCENPLMKFKGRAPRSRHLPLADAKQVALSRIEVSV